MSSIRSGVVHRSCGLAYNWSTWAQRLAEIDGTDLTGSRGGERGLHDDRTGQGYILPRKFQSCMFNDVSLALSRRAAYGIQRLARVRGLADKMSASFFGISLLFKGYLVIFF